MSKKCCGIIYKDEKFCTMCGKALADLPDIDEQEAEAKAAGDEVEEADKKMDKESDKETTDETAKNVAKKVTDDSAVMLDMAEVDKIAASVLGDKTQAVMDDSTMSATDNNSKSVADNEGGEKPTDKVEETADSDLDKQLEEKSQDKLDDNDASSDNKDKQDESDEEDDDDEDYDDGSASGGLKFFGTLMILIMLASIAFVGLAIYFVILNPFYKDHDINKPVEYEQMATDTDVTNIESRPALFEVSIEDATETDAEAIATDGDASDETDTDVDENEDGDETDDENTDNEDSDNEDSDNEDSDSDESVEE